MQGDKRWDRGPCARVNDHTPGAAGLGPDGLWARARDECRGGEASRERLAAGDLRGRLLRVLLHLQTVCSALSRQRWEAVAAGP